MIEIEFTEEAIDELRYQRFNHPHPRVQRKMEALLLKSDGLPHHQITRGELKVSDTNGIKLLRKSFSRIRLWIDAEADLIGGQPTVINKGWNLATARNR